MAYYYQPLTKLDPLPMVAWYQTADGWQHIVAVSHTAHDVLVWHKRRHCLVSQLGVSLYTRHPIVSASDAPQ